MEGHETISDLRLKLGVEPIGVMLSARKVQYIGRLWRYPDARLEKQLVFGEVGPDGGMSKGSKRTESINWRSQVWDTLEHFALFCGEPLGHANEDSDKFWGNLSRNKEI